MLTGKCIMFFLIFNQCPLIFSIDDPVQVGEWGPWTACGSKKSFRSRERTCNSSVGCPGQSLYEETKDCGDNVVMPGKAAPRGRRARYGKNKKDDFCNRDDSYWTSISTGSGIIYSHGSYGINSSAVQKPWTMLYENGQRTCIYLQVENCKKVSFEFPDSATFEIESQGSDCPYDWIRVVDGSGTVLLEDTCGHTAPSPFHSDTNKVLIIFKSDATVRKRGFKLQWNATGGCEWSAWSSGKCDPQTGFQSFLRRCTKDPANCPCNCTGSDKKYLPCSVSCRYGLWTEWSECVLGQGGKQPGIQTRERLGNSPTAKNGGVNNCTTQTETRECGTPPEWTKWSPWSECMNCSCTRERTCLSSCPSFNSTQCSGEYKQSKRCPVKENWTPWSSWSGCYPSGSKYQQHVRSESRRRTCRTTCDGGNCTGPAEELRCCPLGCGWSSWSPSGECDQNSGKQIYTREPDSPKAQCNGSSCDGSCFKVEDCAVDCVWGKWAPFSICDKMTNKQFWVRHPLVTAKNGGKPCSCKDDECDAKIMECNKNNTCTDCPTREQDMIAKTTTIKRTGTLTTHLTNTTRNTATASTVTTSTTTISATATTSSTTTTTTTTTKTMTTTSTTTTSSTTTTTTTTITTSYATVKATTTTTSTTNTTTTIPIYPDALVLTGGKTNRGRTDFVEAIFPFKNSVCTVPALETPRRWHVSFLLGDNLMACGGVINRGYGRTDTCVRLDTVSGAWILHSKLTSIYRDQASYLKLGEQSCIFGGYTSSDKNSYECWTGAQWKKTVERIPGDGVAWSCAVGLLDDNGVVIIGGIYSRTQVMYRSNTGSWDTTGWDQLPERRYGHSCSLLGVSKIMVAGGVTNGYTSTTRIINTATKKIERGPDMKARRHLFAMFVEQGKIYAMGGYGGYVLDTMEYYDEERDEWTKMNQILQQSVYEMGYAKVPVKILGCVHEEVKGDEIK